MKTTLAALLLFGCAAARPSPELVAAREAYHAAETGPAGELNPADLHEARVLLGQAENSAQTDSSDLAVHNAYLALRRAQLADSQGRMSAALSRKTKSQQDLAALKDQSLANAKGQLAQASAVQVQTENDLSQTQRQLNAEHQSRVEMHGQLKEASAAQQRTQAQLAQAVDQVDTEHQARLEAEQRTLDALGRIAAVRQEARGMVIILSGSVLFGSGMSALLPSAQAQLDQVALALKKSDRTILIEGHTDSSGSDARNQQLSKDRAQAVMDYLVAHGVGHERVRALGLGQSRPIAENATAEGRASNRRVEVVVEPRPAKAN